MPFKADPSMFYSKLLTCPPSTFVPSTIDNRFCDVTSNEENQDGYTHMI